MNALRVKLTLYHSYVLTAIRNFHKNTHITILNATGLILGISSFIFISLYVYNEISFDRHIKDGNLIYRATFSWKALADSERLDMSLSIATLPEQLILYFSEVEAATGMARLPNHTIVQTETDHFLEENLFETDTSFFAVIQPEILLGDIQNIGDPTSLVLTERLAKKYFGDADPIEQTLLVNNNPYSVVAVIKDSPNTSSIQYDALLFTFSSDYYDWCFTFFKIQPGIIEQDLEAKINDVLYEEYGSYFSEVNATGSYELEKLYDIHFGKAKLHDAPKGSKLMLYILITIALLILVISVVNYINLSIAQISGRQIEVGMRKIFGATKSQAVFQYIFEFLLIVFFCLIVSVIFLAVLFNILGEQRIFEITPNLKSIVFVASFVVIAIFLLSIFVGGYIYSQTADSPLHNLSQQSGFKGNSLFRRSLLGFQFTTSITLIFGALVAMNQIQLINERVSKMDINQVMVIDLPASENSSMSIETFHNMLRQAPYVKSFSTVGNRSLPTLPTDFELFAVKVNGQPKIQTYSYARVDEKFFDALGIPILIGRNFSEVDFENKWNSPIVNEAFVRSQGWKDPLNRQITHFGSTEHGEGRIIGVVPDFPFHGFQQKVQPMIFYPNRGLSDKLIVRYSTLDNGKIEAIKQMWEQEMELPMEFHFLDEYFLKAVAKEENLQKLLFCFSALCLLIAGLGLFGIININLYNQQRDVAIRKVFGARLSDLIVYTWKEYVLILLLSAILAYPIGLMSLNNWLENFPHQVDISFIEYIKAIAIIVGVMLVVLVYHTLKMANAKTIKWLRND